jgi:hypothetical protein
MKLRLPAALALAALAALPGTAQARTIQLDGNVVGSPSAEGSRVTLPLLLGERAAGRLGLGKAAVRVRLPLHGGVDAPTTSGVGRIGISPLALRVGDRLRGRTSISRRSRRRLRNRAVPVLALRGARIERRASTLSVDELTLLFGDLSQQLTLFQANVQAFATNVLAQLSGQQVEVEALKAQLAALAAGLSALEGSVATLQAALEGLQGVIDPEVLAALQANVADLLARVAALEALLGSLPAP